MSMTAPMSMSMSMSVSRHRAFGRRAVTANALEAQSDRAGGTLPTTDGELLDRAPQNALSDSLSHIIFAKRMGPRGHHKL